MRAKSSEKNQAIDLRKNGWSYNAIKKSLNISKGTLSIWLRDMPLSPARIRELRNDNEVRIERYRETRRRTRTALLEKTYKEEKDKIGKLSARDIFLSGLCLYWGEGGKTKPAEIHLTNTDPSVIKAFICWIESAFSINRKETKVKLHLYRDMDPEKEILFWVKTTGIPTSRFKKPYIKTSTSASITYKNGFGHGTCTVGLCNATIARKVLMGLEVLKNHFLKQS